MKIAIVAPSAVPFLVGGAEKLWWGLLHAINQHTPHHAELIKLPSPEQGFWELMASYRSFSRLDLGHFDLVISTKYPAWMVAHRNHSCYLQHRLRGLYDTYHLTGLPTTPGEVPAILRPLVRAMDTSRGERTELEPFFDLLFGLRDDPSLPPTASRSPAPWPDASSASWTTSHWRPPRFAATSRSPVMSPSARITSHPALRSRSSTTHQTCRASRPGAMIICLPRAGWIILSAWISSSGPFSRSRVKSSSGSPAPAPRPDRCRHWRNRIRGFASSDTSPTRN